MPKCFPNNMTRHSILELFSSIGCIEFTKKLLFLSFFHPAHMYEAEKIAHTQVPWVTTFLMPMH
ncbi:hypothetical protein ACHAWF_008636 [Thalassiosira exigua]